uniref:Uncharacterized protein n=1 Tax=Ananas comosus var. bracteatus TaxID=296719 RepID=A0A6V7PFB5_ANACO|nr:unnamed protein product [Ananas comosus var. bracteatus]
MSSDQKVRKLEFWTSPESFYSRGPVPERRDRSPSEQCCGSLEATGPWQARPVPSAPSHIFLTLSSSLVLGAWTWSLLERRSSPLELGLKLLRGWTFEARLIGVEPSLGLDWKGSSSFWSFGRDFFSRGILRLVDNSVRRIEGARDGSVGLT